MCRIFGFRSVILSQVHTSLISAENALIRQSGEHPDGWGVAYYVLGAPHIVKSAATAFEDSLFKRVSGVVSSQTVIAHIRRSTVGTNSIINAHPFQYGSWTFAHNGNLKGFIEKRETLLSRIAPGFRRFILGETDSEAMFFLILSHLAGRHDLERDGCAVEDLAAACQDAMAEIQDIFGEFTRDTNGPPEDTYLTFIISDGKTMLAHQGGKELHYSTYKHQCPDRGHCPSFARECENPTESGFVNHLIFTSEPLQGENICIPMTPNQMIGVDRRMQLWHSESKNAKAIADRPSLRIIK